MALAKKDRLVVAPACEYCVFQGVLKNIMMVSYPSCLVDFLAASIHAGSIECPHHSCKFGKERNNVRPLDEVVSSKTNNF